MTRSEEIARLVARIASDKKGMDVVILDLRGISLIADYFVITSGATTIQVQALARHIEEGLGQLGIRPLRREGWRQASWILLDYGEVVVHIFLEEVRRFYDLERLWGDAEVVNWEG
ncbi:MAG: ribosome-associated protein [Clostridia bacterium]|nr:ribosome-associated protein [Clostridia bacterium]